MKKIINHIYLIAVFSIMISCINNNGPVKVELKFKDGKYQLYRGRKPYYINGAGCEFGNIANLASHGANSMRTWRTDNGNTTGQEVLDEAQKNGITVMMGLEIGRERHGFDYNDSVWVIEQFEYIKGEILKYKDHPALLSWGIGNELNLEYENKKVWDAVNDIAKMIHEVDGNHPTTTMLAGIGKGEVDYIRDNCPDLDFLCIQMYGDIENLAQRIEDAGYDGPYVVTEWGATGHWEVANTEWGIPIEQTSSEKADAISRRWKNNIKSNQTHCLGSYVFLWEQKQERTPTWYGLFLETGEESEAIDVMEHAWTGKWPENKVPRIDFIKLDDKTRYDNIHLESDKEYLVEFNVNDPEGNSLSVKCEILPDISDYWGLGGDYENRPETIFKMEDVKYNGEIVIKAPEKSGPYRVFVYIFDGNNNAAYANVPFFVDE
ncbi:glycoside hydrolase family 2 TIM barrel-domain containing protein [Bacteroidota bacterium]